MRPKILNVPRMQGMILRWVRRHARRTGDRYYGAGPLHIWLDDHNVSASHVGWCAEYAAEQGDRGAALIARVACCMSTTQRARLSGWWCSEQIGSP